MRCGPTCKGNPRRPDCVCGLVPPEGSFRKKGLWRKDADALLENLGRDPADLKRLARTHPAGLKNLGNTCYVNAVLQCLFAIPTFRAAVYRLGPGDTNDGHTTMGTMGTRTMGTSTMGTRTMATRRRRPSPR